MKTSLRIRLSIIPFKVEVGIRGRIWAGGGPNNVSSSILSLIYLRFFKEDKERRGASHYSCLKTSLNWMDFLFPNENLV